MSDAFGEIQELAKRISDRVANGANPEVANGGKWFYLLPEEVELLIEALVRFTGAHEGIARLVEMFRFSQQQ